MANGVSLNWGGFDKAVGNALKKMSDKKELMASVGCALVSGTIKRFHAGTDPDGNAWEKSYRAESTGGRTLLDTGRLRSSIDFAATPQKVMVGSSVKYARIHQLGGDIKAKNGKALKFKGKDGKAVLVKKVAMPARPYLGVSKDDMAEVRATVKSYLAGCFKP